MAEEPATSAGEQATSAGEPATAPEEQAASAAEQAASAEEQAASAGEPATSAEERGTSVSKPDLSRRALAVAPDLLGCVLRVGGVGVRLVEVEAYEGADDPASHAWRGRTRRNGVMFEAGGLLYVFTMHGHHCANIVCGPQGIASAVLLRAGEVVAGIDEARRRRPRVRDAWLARGPGNLCRVLGITLDDAGAGLTGPRLILERGEGPDAVASGPRVNVSRAADVPWRFWDAASASVSAFTAHPAGRGPTQSPPRAG